MAAPNLRLPDAAIEHAARKYQETLMRRVAGFVTPWEELDPQAQKLYLEAQRAACEEFVRRWL